MKLRLNAQYRKSLILRRLKNHANRGLTVCYSDLFEDIFPSRRWWGLYLGEICRECLNKGEPLLPVLAVTKESLTKDGVGYPSHGFLEFNPVRRALLKAGFDPESTDQWLAAERQRCFSFHSASPAL